MRIQARQGSAAELRYYEKSALPQPWPKSNGPRKPRAIAPGINPDVLEDLIQHGGKEVPQIEFQNLYLGGSASWATQDVRTIDAAIKLAMQDRRRNNVMLQYFPGVALNCDMRESFVLDGVKPLRLDEPDLQAAVANLYDSSLIKKTDLGSTIFNLILSPGTVLKLGSYRQLMVWAAITAPCTLSAAAKPSRCITRPMSTSKCHRMVAKTVSPCSTSMEKRVRHALSRDQRVPHRS